MKFKLKLPVRKKKHKYMSELFIDSLPFPYCERNYPKFDERDTFNLYSTMIMWLYERLRYFEDVVVNTVVMDDPTWRTFEIDGEQLTQLKCIERMLFDCRILLLKDDFDDHEEMDAAMRDLFKVFSEVYWSMWW